ncbi:MAG: hypothetical protein TQ35_0004130 [Candidatus Aramenus sulfurataquae]|uniref:CobQ/CobB/MinD/ParA nucleotide binding domain-containing protein n=2 Tax=Candidatus Aramenus sulfurataquae TaxID=1326980 RepID=A0A0F2LM56_9CREN|nr:hypothetical protein [Candidatus Aramenus sulfurataquae]
MIRLSLLSVKRGVGKTTVSYYLARELSRRMKVILVVVGSYNVLAKIFGVEDSLIDWGRGRLLRREGWSLLPVLR